MRECVVFLCEGLSGVNGRCMAHYIRAHGTTQRPRKRHRTDDTKSPVVDPEQWLKLAKEKELKIARRFAK